MHSIICRAVIGHSRYYSCIYTKHLTLNVNKLCCRASAHMPLSSTESLHYHCITGFFRDQMLWENHIQFQFQRYSWSSSIIILHLRYVAKKKFLSLRPVKLRAISEPRVKLTSKPARENPIYCSSQQFL